ncbi:MAG: hypothetical protein WCI51_07445 [Lentisphaerota bacterium]
MDESNIKELLSEYVALLEERKKDSANLRRKINRTLVKIDKLEAILKEIERRDANAQKMQRD